MTTLRDQPASVQDEFVDLFLGEQLGAGIHRTVYEHRLDPKLVIKVETTARTFANIHEWQVWEEVVYAPKARVWFAPCRWISHSGSILIQERTQPITRLPAELPNFLTDIKVQNYGRLRGRVVAHDYGYTRLLSRGFSGWRMTKVEA